jgi:NADH-ubiquinone oxidoreductase chain 2
MTIVLFTSIILLLLSNATTLRRDKSILYSRATSFILIYCVLITYYIINVIYLQKSISLYNGLLFCKNHTLIFTMFVFIVTYVILLLTSFYPRKFWSEKITSFYDIIMNRKKMDKLHNELTNANYLNKTAEQFKIIEYPLIILFILSGGAFLMSSSDLITIFLSIELQSYGLYLLCSIYRNSELATNAGLTYFLLGGLSSCIILLGQSLLYINSGNTSLDTIYIMNSIFINTTDTSASITDLGLSQSNININNMLNIDQYFIQLSMVILSTGFLFKISAAPFHFWSPDVYDSIPTIVTTFVAIIAKITILIFLLELVYYTSITSFTFSWKNNLLLSSLLSLIIGSILGLTQNRIKRLFAYSTISHLGFILLALSINSIESIQAFYFYIIQYSVTNLNAFLILISIGYSFLMLTTNKKEQSVGHELGSVKENMDSYSPIQLISQIKGFFYINSILAISLAITLYSFVGVPPLMGFFAKQMILSAALDNGYVFMSLVGIITSVIAAVYYLAIIKELFFEKNEYSIKNTGSKSIFLSSSLTSSISILTLIILLFIFIPQEFLYLTSILSLTI